MRIIDKSDDRKLSTEGSVRTENCRWVRGRGKIIWELHSASFASNVRRLGISKLQRVAPLRA